MSCRRGSGKPPLRVSNVPEMGQRAAFEVVSRSRLARVIRGERQSEQATALVVCQRGNVPSRSRGIRIIVVHQWNILAIEGCFRDSQTAVAQFRSPASLDRPTTWAGLGRMNQSGTLRRATSVRQVLAWVPPRFLILACDEWIPRHPVDRSEMSPVSTV